MAVTHLTATRNGISDYVVDQLDGGSVRFYATNGTTTVAELTFGTPAFGAATSGVATANAITSDTSAAGGSTPIANLTTSGGSEIVECSVGTSGQDINLSNNVIGTGDTVSMSSLTYTAPA
jgi:hypothetical protein